MSRWLLVVATGLVLLALAPKPTVGQSARGKWMLPRTSWGEPDLSGIWDFRTMTSLERPAELAGKEVLTDGEAADYERKRLRALDKDRRASDGDSDGDGDGISISAEQDVRNAYNQFWWDYGTKLTEDKRTALIVDPPDGKIPPLTPLALGRRDARRELRRRPPRRPGGSKPLGAVYLGG